MRPSALGSIACFTAALFIAPYSVASDLSVPAQQVKAGDTVWARTDAKGDVLIESDLSRTSSQRKVGQDGKVSIGNANAPGISFVRLVTPDGGAAVICVVVTEGGGRRLVAESIKLTDREPAAAAVGIEDTLLKKFADEVAKDQYAAAVAAARNVARGWLVKHAVDATATVTICILPVPGTQTVCVARIGDHLVDLGFEFTDALIDECKGLRDEEKRSLHRWLQAGRTLVDLRSIIRADRKLEKVIEAASAGVSLAEFTAKDKGGTDLAVSVIGNNFVGIVDKAAVTIKVVARK
jgi:hypothetical protein